jgi:hypothetical protein
VLPNYTSADVQNRVCAYLASGGVPTTGCPATPTNPVINVANTTIAVPNGPAINAKQVTLAYTHNFMFIGPIIGFVGGTWNNAKTITIDAVMRTEM